MSSIVENFALYKALESSFDGSSADAFIDEDDPEGSPPRSKQLCIRLYAHDFAEFAALTYLFGVTRQTFGRLCIQSGVASAMALLKEKDCDAALPALYDRFLRDFNANKESE